MDRNDLRGMHGRCGLRDLQPITGRDLMNYSQVMDIQRKIPLQSLGDWVSMRIMKGCLNNWGGWLAVAILAAASLPVAQAAEIKAARVWAGPEYTRLVLDTSGPVKYTTRQKGGQLIVELADSRARAGFSGPAASGLFKGMSQARVGDRLRLTATVDPDSRLKSFVLPARAGSNYRVVLDLYPGHDKAGQRATGGSVAAEGTRTGRVAASALKTTYRNPTHSGRVAADQAAAMLNGQRTVVVVVDAGHGGKDQGAHGPNGTLEKNVTLAVARDLAADIDRQPGMKAVLTRKGDYFIPLKERYEIARENDADLFVSIHADAFTNDDAKGASVWVLSSRGKSSMAARWLADRENRSDLIGGVSLDDMNDGLAKVLLNMQQGWAIRASDEVAGNVLNALAKLGPTHRNHVEHANFVVLRSPDVPSILVETAFISNPVEEKKLRSPAHQKRIAEAVMSGVKGYFESTPPPGTWFAAQAAGTNGTRLASTTSDSPGSTVASVARSGSGGRVGSRGTHKVGRGESLSSIAKQYGVSVNALKNANQMNSNTVRAGAILAIPTS